MNAVSDVTLVFHNTPFFIVGGVVGAFLLLTIAARVRDWLQERRERKAESGTGEESGGVTLAPAPRREAMELIEKLGAVRARMLELDRALTQRKTGVQWQIGIGRDGNRILRDVAASDVDRFLSDATERDLTAAQKEMISFFRDAANWLEKYAPEEVPPPPLLHRIAAALRTFAGRFFPALKPDADRKMQPVVRKASATHSPDSDEPPGKVADGETPTDAAAASGETPKTREKLRIPLDLLEVGKPEKRVDGASVREEARRLADTLQTYKIDAVPTGTPVRGPSATRYDFRLQPGVKLNKLMSLSDDIALSLGVGGVRIAPVPGQSSVVGIEAPNAKRSIVSLRGVLEERGFMYCPSTAFVLGKGIDGEIVTGDLEELSHVLIAGTTGSGKSVCLNAIIMSLLYKAAPEEMRLLLIDPKQVELTPYNGIPHLSQPVVTSPAQAVAALRQAVDGMETRYKAFEDLGVKELSDYNRKSKTPFPRIVIVIDELADLMMASGKSVEASIVRIAQTGRAAGFHLVVATQSPRADVITGMMKANIPSRIAFTVASSLESRIILDANGAETLTGGGDMLYAPINGKRQRVQGCYVSPEEVGKVVSFLKRAGK